MSTSANRLSWRGLLPVVGVLLALPLGAHAAEIDLTTYPLLANTPDQMISIFVVGGTTASPANQAVTGVNLEIYTSAVGYTNLGSNLGGTSAGNAPSISNVDLFASGAVFQNNNNGNSAGGMQSNGTYLAYNPAQPTAANSQFWAAETQTNSGTVNLPSTPQLLAVVTIDTTGFFGGTYHFSIDDPNQPTNFVIGGGQTTTQMFPTVIDGFLQIGSQSMPEPASIGLLALAVGGMLLRRRAVG